jgi:hypothetical protein
MSLRLDLFTAIALLGFGLPGDAHDIYSPLRDRLGNSCCQREDGRPRKANQTGCPLSGAGSSFISRRSRTGVLAVPDGSIHRRTFRPWQQPGRPDTLGERLLAFLGIGRKIPPLMEPPGFGRLPSKLRLRHATAVPVAGPSWRSGSDARWRRA